MKPPYTGNYDLEELKTILKCYCEDQHQMVYNSDWMQSELHAYYEQRKMESL